ncbi:EH domain-containing and endocytosis protein 1 [Grifola frondosa]|uniref:EH domain-containing and endocytosis protein 1 n=1 Tax=Grifola frondosa TaxID=5627 RepID=A0A1C7MJK1_GRIFR|nr:EH domain-containing and endocytosis protein 1 [Grifola frondosa]
MGTSAYAYYDTPQQFPHPSSSAAQSQVPFISADDDIQRLFNVCRVGHGNAELLHEVLVFAKPEDLKDEINKEFRAKCRESQELIVSQIPWASAQAETSRRAARTVAETTEEQLLAALLSAHEELTESLKMFEDLERIGIEAEAEERRKTERLIQALTALSDFRATPEEANLIDQVFALGDPQHTGRLSARAASKIFGGSNLPPTTHAKIWDIATVDSAGKDGLDRQGVGVALRLIGHAQLGVPVTEALVKKPGPLAVIEGFSSIAEPAPGPSTSAAGGLPPLTARDQAKFRKIFLGSSPVNGLLSGAQARGVFMKSKLPTHTLSQIWSLADVKQRGALDLSDFTVAMYLVQAVMTGQITHLPKSLPPALHEQVAHKPPRSPGPLCHNGGQTLASSSLTPPITPHTGTPHHFRHGTPNTDPRWEISQTMRTYADRAFDSLDLQRTGRIWDLADTGHRGYLTREEFAIAMYLIRMKKKGRELPITLPPELAPSFMRANGSEAHVAMPQPQIQEGLLIDLTDPPESPVSPTVSRAQDRSPIIPGAFPSFSHPLTPNTPSSLPGHGLALQTPLPVSPVNGSFSWPSPPTTGPSTSRSTSAQQHVQLGDVPPAEKARSDQFFDALDTWRKGYVEADVAVPFFSKANLPNDIMASIWDRADTGRDGRLTRDSFAIAMHLIWEKSAERRSRNEQPLPPIPPSPSPQLEPPREPTPERAPPSPQVTHDLGDIDDPPRSDTPPPPYSLTQSDNE